MPKTNPIENPIIAAALNELARAVNLISTYGKTHPAAKTSIPRTLEALRQLLTDRKQIMLGVFNGTLTIDGQGVQAQGALQKALERRLERLEITGLRLTNGLSTDELEKLIELLSCNNATLFDEELNHDPLQHVSSEHTEYQAVREGQTVANKTEQQDTFENGVLTLNEASFKATPLQQQSGGMHVEQIIAFLKGDLGKNNESIEEELKEAARNPDQLGKLIMESVAIRQAAASMSGETLNDIVLGCLRRTFDGLRRQSNTQSSKEKAALRQSLLLLEKSLLEKIRDLTGEEDPELDRQIDQAVRTMGNELKFEIHAAEYQKNKVALQQQLQELDPELAAKWLNNSGIPQSEWRQFVIENHQTENEIPSALSHGLSTLSTVFEKLEKLMESQKQNDPEFQRLLSQANDKLERSSDNTKQKLENLASTIEGKARRMPREELLATLSEITQELMQPLTAINVTLEMLSRGFSGEMTPEQEDLIGVASRSGEHLHFLLDQLTNIVGYPASTGVDARYHITSDEVQFIKQKKQ